MTVKERISTIAAHALPERLKNYIKHKITDVYVISFPKCGRTWLRILLGKVLQLHYNLEIPNEYYIDIHKLNLVDKKIPRIDFDHEDNPKWRSPSELSKNKEKFKNKKVIFLVRDPKDVLISLYFHKKYRDNAFDGEIEEFLQEKVGGIETIIEYYNIWYDNREIPKDFLLVKYEELTNNTMRELKKIMNFLKINSVSDETIEEAIQFASFDKMKKMENESFFSEKRMKPGEEESESSYKTRKGKVGGYAEYLSNDNIDYLDKLIGQRLNKEFGY